jgi:SAM-dependent methyltransferase
MRRHLGSLAGKRLLKLDLWNEAQNTELLFWAAREGATCYGIDIADTTSRKGRDRGRALGVPIRVIVGDILALPFPDDSFDCLYTMGTLEHVPGAERVMAEVARVVKPGGVAIVGVPNKLDPFLFAIASRVLQAFRCYPYGYERWFTNGELGRALQAQGLRVIQRDGILFFPWFLRFLDLYLWLHRPAACRLTGLLLEPFRALRHFRGLVRRFGYLTVCVAQK